MSKARRIVKQKLESKQDALSGIPAITGNQAGVVAVPGRTGYIYTRVGDQVVEVFNNRVATIADIPVTIGVEPYAPNLLQVLSLRSSGATSSNAARALSVPSHHTKHEWPSEDTVFVDLRQLMPLRVSPAGDYKIFVHRAVVAIGDTILKVEPTETVDLYSLVPITPDYARYVLITLDTSGEVSTTAGTEVDVDDLDLSDIPARPAGHRRLAAVRLYYGQSAIVEAITTNDIIDLRWNFDAAAAEAHASSHENGGGDEISVAGLSGELADPQPPKSHASSHLSAGSDAIKLDDLAAPDDNTDLDASTSRHGLMPKFPGGSNFLRADGTWTTPSGSGDMAKSTYDTDDDGVVDLAEGIDGMASAGNLKYYGTDASGTEGIHSLPATLTVEESDGTPSVSGVDKIKFSGAVVTDDGNGDVTITITGGGGGAPVDASYIVEDANASLTAESVLGTSVIKKDTYANKPASAKAGRLFFPSNSYYIARDNGAQLEWWGPIYRLVPPPIASNWTWVNQGSCSVEDNQGALIVQSGNTDTNLHLLVKSAPSTPYKITAGFVGLFPVGDQDGFGICFRESSSGKLHTFNIEYYGSWSLNNYKWNSPTSFNSGYNSVTAMHGLYSMIFLQMEDDGTNRKMAWSIDGRKFFTSNSVARTDFLTADQVGVFLRTKSTRCYFTLLSWEVE